jgi:15-cis-phytoene synthase
LAQSVCPVPRNGARRQLFVPVQLLARQGIGAEAIFAAKQTPPVRAALDQLIAEARHHLEAALSLLPDIVPEARPMFLPLAVVRHDLVRMSRADSDPFMPRTASRLSILWTLWRASKSNAFRR